MSIVKLVMQCIGLLEWGYLTLLLMEVVICKDARLVNTGKLLSCSVRARAKLFKRSLKSVSYRVAVGLFIGSLMAVMIMVNEIWTGFLPMKKFGWIVFSTFFPLCVAILYHLQGYDISFFKKFRLFLDGKLE